MPREERNAQRRATTRFSTLSSQPFCCGKCPPPSTCNQEKKDAKPSYLHWTWDPEESYSDWTVVIQVAHNSGNSSLKSKETTPAEGAAAAAAASATPAAKTTTESKIKTRTYRIHKCVIAAGPKRCEYFRRAFSQENLAESTSETSTIEFEEIVAKAFPQFLNYMYSPNDEVVFTLDNVVPLYFLADYFQCDLLKSKASQSFTLNQSVLNGHVLYSHASLLGIWVLADDMETFFKSHICEIACDNPLLLVTDEQFWLNLLQAEPRLLSAHKSRLVASFCSAFCASRSMTRTAFLALTDKELLPEIHWLAAQSLVLLERQLNDATEEEPSCLSSLEERCLDSLAKSSATISTGDGGEAFLSKCSHLFVRTLLLRVVEQANHGIPNPIPQNNSGFGTNQFAQANSPQPAASGFVFGGGQPPAWEFGQSAASGSGQPMPFGQPAASGPGQPAASASGQPMTFLFPQPNV